MENEPTGWPLDDYNRACEEFAKAFTKVAMPILRKCTLVIPDALVKQPDGTFKSIGEVRIPLSKFTTSDKGEP